MKYIVHLFENNSVSVSGLKGRGKDILFANVIARRNKEYISNLDYKCKCKFNQFNINDFNVNNDYSNFLNHNINYYDIKFNDNVDTYLSDCGIYFPSQFVCELNKKYNYYSCFMALSRHLNNSRVHTNSQCLNRVWDKIREQSDIYIVCMSCVVLFKKIVIQRVRIYEKYDSAINNVPPFTFKTGLLTNKNIKTQVELARINYKIAYGDIKKRTLIYINKSNYDTRFFKEYLKNGKKQEKK